MADGSVCRVRIQARVTDCSRRTEAENSNKPELIAPLLAEKSIFTGTDGLVMDRAGELALEKSNHYLSSKVDDFKVKVYGNTAITSYALHTTRSDKSGPFEKHERVTDTWIKMPNGKWQVVASHGSNISAAAAKTN